MNNLKTEEKLLLAMLATKEIKDDLEHSPLWDDTLNMEFQLKYIGNMLTSLGINYADMFTIAQEYGYGYKYTNETTEDHIIDAYSHFMLHLFYKLAEAICHPDHIDEAQDYLMNGSRMGNQTHDQHYTFEVDKVRIVTINDVAYLDLSQYLDVEHAAQHEKLHGSQWGEYLYQIIKNKCIPVMLEESGISKEIADG